MRAVLFISEVCAYLWYNLAICAAVLRIKL